MTVYDDSRNTPDTDWLGDLADEVEARIASQTPEEVAESFVRSLDIDTLSTHDGTRLAALEVLSRAHTAVSKERISPLTVAIDDGGLLCSKPSSALLSAIELARRRAYRDATAPIADKVAIELGLTVRNECLYL